MYSDEYIDHWGRVFEARDLHRARGIRFDTFLLAPTEILAAVDATPAAEPLLPAQAAVMHRDLEAELPDGTALRGDRYVQRLRHHNYAVSGDRHLNLARRGVA